MDRGSVEIWDLGAEETVLVDRDKLSRILGMEIPAIGLDSEASFERLVRALAHRRERRRRWRLLLAYSLGAATFIAGLITMFSLLPR
jgi:hypothetical protein